MKQQVKTLLVATILIAILHLAVFLLLFEKGWIPHPSPENRPGLVAVALPVLALPWFPVAQYLHEVWHLASPSGYWLSFVANSLTWGLAIALGALAVRRRLRRGGRSRTDRVIGPTT